MNFGKNGRVIYLVLSGVILLVFVVGLLCGGWLFSRWQQPAGLVTTVAFATVTPGGPSLTAEQPLSTPTGSTAAPCSPPAGWTLYTIQPSDTLSQLAEQAGVSQAQVLAVNCLASPEIVAGATLYLPSPPTPTPCTIVPPLGWGLYTAQPGDSLSALAAARNITIEEVERRNCLASPDILEGQQLYLPLLPTPTPCAVAPPPNWGPYTIQTGDTLFSLAAARGTTAEQIKQVNCLAAETIQIGQQLYLTLLPTPTPTFPPPPTLPPTALPTPVPPPAALPTPAQPLLSQPDTSAGVSPSQPGGDSTTIGQAQAPGADSSISGGQPSPGVDATSVEVQTSQGPANSSQPPSDFPPLVADLSDFYGPSPCPQGGSPFLKLRGASKVELGQRAYFFICNPPGKPTSALVTWPDGQTQQGADLFKVPFTDPKTNAKTSEVAIVWPALPFYPTGTYTVTVTSPASIPPLPFTITLPAKDRILAVPPVGFPGDTFQVYYVRVPATGGVITMIVGLKEPTSPQKPLSIGTDHLFKIDKAEWGMSPLYLGPTESPGDYVVSNDITKTFHANITLSPP